MAGQLQKCIDCGTDLSITAKECGVCKSTDPFGTQRFNEKMKMMGFLLVVAVAVIVGALAYFNIIDVKSIFNL